MSRRNNLIFGGIVAALLGGLLFPTWRWVFREWLSNEYYSHGLLVLAVSAFLVWRATRRYPIRTPDNRALFGLALFSGLYLLFYSRQTFFVAAIVSVALVACLLWFVWGVAALRRMAFPLAFLALAIPLPIVDRATLPLSLWAGTLSAGAARLLGVAVSVTGAAVSLPNTTLTIGAACSGINSIIALLTLTSLAAYLLNGPWWGKTLLVAASVPLAMLGNILRITNLIVVARWWGVSAAFEFYHTYAGGIFFLLAMILLLPLSRLLRCKTLRWDVL